MTFPLKFKKQLEKGLNDVTSPDYIYLVYAICGLEKDSCGWEGWMLEAVFKKSEDKYPTITGDKLLSSVNEQVCPKCGKTTFRTDVVLRFELSKEPIVSNAFEYAVAPMEYVDE